VIEKRITHYSPFTTHFAPLGFAGKHVLLLQIPGMKKRALAILFTICFYLLSVTSASAQCSVCTKTAQQLGEKPARGMNSGILYLAFAPFAIVGFIGYRWWQNNKQQ
jgi:hypothetical protein